MASLESLPDVCILHIAQYLELSDLCRLMKVNDRLCDIACDRMIARHTDFEGNYMLGEEDICNYIGSAGHYIERLSFRHCHWIPSRVIQWSIHNCKKLTHLNLIECRIKTSAMVQQLSSIPNLLSLSFSISSFSDIKKDLFADAADTLKNVRSLHIFFTSRELTTMTYLGEHMTLIDYCTNLEEIKISSAAMAIPELYRPIISTPHNHLKLSSMCITNNIHAGAQMLFYGTLSQLPNSQLYWKTLLMPNVNFHEFAKKPEFRDCLKNIRNLRVLDLSGSKVTFPNSELDLSLCPGLEHLSLASTLTISEQLIKISQHSTMLNSLNLNSCPRLLHIPGLPLSCVGSQGVLSVAQHCRYLRHLNLSGEHHHSHHCMKQLFEQLKGLHSLSISPCMLWQEGDDHRRPAKRIASTRSAYAPTKRRCMHHTTGASSSSSSAVNHGTCHSGPASSETEAPPTLLHTIVANNPDLEQLEIIAVGFNSVIHKNKFISIKSLIFNPCPETRAVKDASLLALTKLTRLRSLTLVGLAGLTSGHCLAAIVRSCESLHTLSLAMLGSALHGNIFIQSLQHAKSLQNIRIEQPYLSLNGAFFDGLASSPQLRRVCIFAKESSFTREHVLSLVDRSRFLCVLIMYAGGTITLSKNMTTTLKQKYCRSGRRPGATFSIHPLLSDGLSDAANSLPAKHHDELARFYSKVAAYPTNCLI